MAASLQASLRSGLFFSECSAPRPRAAGVAALPVGQDSQCSCYPRRLGLSHERRRRRRMQSSCAPDLASLVVNSDGTPPPSPAPIEEEIPIEKRFPAFPTVLDINQIRDILPHRFPFLLVDRIVEYNPGVSAVGIKNVTINDNFFPGHFPERPIMPGVLMIEAMAQVGGIVMLQPEFGGSKDNFFFAGVDKVRFRKPVIAGDTLVMRMNLTKFMKRFGIVKMEGKAYVGGEVVCEGEFMMAVVTE